MYTSNVLKSQPEFDLQDIQYHVCKLSVSEADANRLLRDNKISVPCTVYNSKIYYMDNSIENEPLFNTLVSTNSPHIIQLKINYPENSRILKRILRKAMSNLLLNKGFEFEGKHGNGIAYKRNNELFQKKIKEQGSNTIFRITRGFRPIFYIPRSGDNISLTLEPSSRTRIFVPYNSWDEWIETQVYVDDRSLDLQGLFILVDVDEMGQVGILEQNGQNYEAPLDTLRVPAKPEILASRGVLDPIFHYANFKSQEGHDTDELYNFIMNIMDSIAVDNVVMVNLDGSGNQAIGFEQIIFEGVE